MEVDSQKLLSLIKPRAAIYNPNLKDHSNKIVVDRLWNEIAREMQSTANECKHRWTSLRSAYSRQLREERLGRSTTMGKRRKRWYLTDCMAFLREYMLQHRSTRSLSASPELEDRSELTMSDTKSVLGHHIHSPMPAQVSKPVETALTALPPIPAPAIEQLPQAQSTPQAPPKPTEPTTDSANVLFFRSMMADFDKLSNKRQRKFRMRMMQLMNDMQEEDENETLYGATTETTVAPAPDTFSTSNMTIEQYKYEIN